MDALPAAIVLVLVAAATAASVVRATHAEREAAARVREIASRLGGAVPRGSHRRLPGALDELEAAADAVLAEAEGSVAIRRVADRLRSALDHVDTGVVISDGEGTVVYRNDRAAAYAEPRHGEALAGRAVTEMLERAVAGVTDERLVELYGPPRRVLAVSSFPLDESDVPLGAVALIDDITDLRRLESVRRDFVANVSHELKTPVGAVGLLAETLSAEPDVEVAQRLAERIQREAIRMARIIDDLLDLSRIEAEESPVREPVAVHLVLAEAVDGVAYVADHRNIPIEVIEPSGRLAVVGNRRQLVSAVHNLLENAVKYSDEGSAVRVTARLAGSFVEIEVVDRGIGIPARDLERIFERFYRVDRARSRETGGTGLGLAIVRHIVNAHDGGVDVDSREGEGSAFTLRLPAAAGSLVVHESEAG